MALMNHFRMSERHRSNQIFVRNFYQKGYNVGNIGAVSERFICLVCSLVLREPTRLVECGHHLCKSCFENQPGNMIICPHLGCQKSTHKNDARSDRTMRKALNYLFVKCLLCTWNDHLEDYQTHLDENHLHLICDQCHLLCDSTYALMRHKLNECPSLFVDDHQANLVWLHTLRQTIAPQHAGRQRSEITTTSMLLGSNESTRLPPMITSGQTAVNVSYSMIVQSQKDDQVRNVASNENSATNEESTRHSNEIADVQGLPQSCAKHLETIKAGMQQLFNQYMELKNKQTDIQQQVAVLQGNPNYQEFIAHDGILLWKLTSFQDKMRDAERQSSPWIESIPFYTWGGGYKMRIRLYLNGAGDERGTNMSIFLILMQGEYDASLTFPFDYKISFCLFDQTSHRRHIIKSIRPKRLSDSSQRPQCEANIPSGTLKFCPLAALQQPESSYIRNDSILIKVMVNTDDIPKSLLPYAFSLESGLPRDVRKAMIQKKYEKQQQSREALAMASSQNDLELSRTIVNLQLLCIEPSQRRQSKSSSEQSGYTSPKERRYGDAEDSS